MTSLQPVSKNVGLEPAGGRLLTNADFHRMAAVPPETEWFANIDNPRTRRAYQIDIAEFMLIVGIDRPEDFRNVTRAHVLLWRKQLEERGVQGSTIRRKLAALSSLFEYLCERNTVVNNPVKGIKRPKVETYEGKTPAIGDHQARRLLDAPAHDTLKGKRDRAILSVFLYHGLRREELCTLKVKDICERRGVKHLRVHGKGNKMRFVPLHPETAGKLDAYLELAGHRELANSALFRPVKNNVSGNTESAITAGSVYRDIVKRYGAEVGLTMERFAPHALRATAATNALENEADIARVQVWLGHANIATTRLYDKRRMRAEDSPTFKVKY